MKVIGDNGKPIYLPNGKIAKIKAPMAGGKLPDGSDQSFYIPNDHPSSPGVFKGMAQILVEQ